MRIISESLLTFLFNACWQIAMITAVTALCARLLRGTAARYQHLLWVVALAFSFSLPVLTSLPLSGGVDTSEPSRAIVQPRGGDFAPTPQLIQDMREAPSPSMPPTLNEAVPFISINSNVSAAVLILYLLFLGYRSGRLCMAWRKAKSLKRSACLIDLPEIVRTTVRESQKALGVRRVRVLCSASIPAPIAVGGLDPLIILPEQLLRETDRGVLTAAIGHELVHIKRRDYLLNLIYEFISLPLSFHPGTALVKRRIRETRELGCDELVTEKLLDAKVYARSLVHLARSAVNMNRPATTITVGIADADILEERVMSILRRPKTNTRRKNLLLVTVALVFIVPCVVAAPFALRIGINPQSAAVAPESTVVTVQQDARQELKPKVIKRVRKERKSSEVEEVWVKDETEATVKQIQSIHEFDLKKRLERKQRLEASLKEARTPQDKEKLEQELKRLDLELKGQRKPEYVFISDQRERANKSNIAELAKKATSFR
jgi:beta-lactamase regulating signal transducer with metallopeptidase domain